MALYETPEPLDREGLDAPIKVAPQLRRLIKSHGIF
jgi:hypothetical protein